MATALSQSEIITLVRKGIRQPSPTTVKDSDIVLSIETAIDELGKYLVGSDPQYFRKRVSLQASGAPHIFTLPSDLFRLYWVKDLGTNAGTITDATNATPIVITEASHGRGDGNITTIHGVLGNTAANGTWEITYIDEDSYSLDGSVGDGAYTSGGIAFKDEDNFPLIDRKPEYDADNSSSGEWFMRDSKLVVDSPSFSDDILIGYTARPSSISDIPSEFHRGLESFAVTDNIELPKSDSPKFADINASYERHASRWKSAKKSAMSWQMSNESLNANTGRRAKGAFI